ncbi:MAG: 3-phosphoshikimate 1-carboxyvinyltransferase [Armatimonadetes bacterium]|nr:3-phosphoshikimate 1-carboxyvinyltransferase [Armatimonadota bacterium]
MSDWTIRGKQAFSGDIQVPGDKSISHRAVMIGSLAAGETHITNFLPSEDCKRTVAVFRSLGVDIAERSATDISVRGGSLSEPDDVLDMGNSGTGLRLLAGVLAGQPFLAVVTGDKSIRQRPMKRVCEPLRKMGATIFARSGDLAPLAVRGGYLKGIDLESPIASAQVKSSVLLAGLFADGQTTVTEPSPSRDHTERMLRAFGADLKREERSVTLQPGSQLRGRTVEVPGDISSAAFFIVGALITPGSALRIHNVGVNPTRTGLLDALSAMGAELSLEDQREASGEPVATIVVRHSELKGTRFGGAIIPRMIDEIPALALAAAFAEDDTVIEDIGELRVKESDRISTVTSALREMGARIHPQVEGLIIEGGGPLTPATVDSHGDHRIAMMSAIAATTTEGETIVRDTDCVNTSFPGFLDLLHRATGMGS